APGDDPAPGGWDPAHAEARRDPGDGEPWLDPGFGGPDPSYGEPRAPAGGQAWQRPDRRRDPEPVTRIGPQTPGGQEPGRQGRETWERYPDWGRRALVGWISGIVATIICDCLRLALVKVGIWGDPIPGIGRLVFADPHANFAWGYLWRFTGNGGGMGIAYVMLPWRGIRTGVAYGTLICTGLVGLLFFFPVAQAHFFPLTPVTAVGAYAGHWVYGAVLGKLTSWWLPPVELGRIHGRLTARLIHPGHRPRPSHARSSGPFVARLRAGRRSA
ncbi:MAG TPA: hypothetical protein VE664_01110, partial [Actinomycetes bacterium]|nr:hypothetical protein [Actinomycetes bacterium]